MIDESKEKSQYVSIPLAKPQAMDDTLRRSSRTKVPPIHPILGEKLVYETSPSGQSKDCVCFCMCACVCMYVCVLVSVCSSVCLSISVCVYVYVHIHIIMLEHKQIVQIFF